MIRAINGLNDQISGGKGARVTDLHVLEHRDQWTGVLMHYGSEGWSVLGNLL